MCFVCESIQEKIQKARLEGNLEKERVMTVILANHRKINHPEKYNVVLTTPSFILWPNGARWVVR